MDNTLIEFFMGHAIGDQVKTYINMPHVELRELYANYEHLLSIEKTSRDELAETGNPSITETAFNDLSQRVAELTRENAEVKAGYEAMRKSQKDLLEKIRIMEEAWGQSIAGIEKFIEVQGKQKK